MKVFNFGSDINRDMHCLQACMRDSRVFTEVSSRNFLGYFHYFAGGIRRNSLFSPRRMNTSKGKKLPENSKKRIEVDSSVAEKVVHINFVICSTEDQAMCQKFNCNKKTTKTIVFSNCNQSSRAGFAARLL